MRCGGLNGNPGLMVADDHHRSGQEREDSRATNGNFGGRCDIRATTVRYGARGDDEVTDRQEVYRLCWGRDRAPTQTFFTTAQHDTDSSVLTPSYLAIASVLRSLRTARHSATSTLKPHPTPLRSPKLYSTIGKKEEGRMQFDASEHPHRRCKFTFLSQLLLG